MYNKYNIKHKMDDNLKKKKEYVNEKYIYHKGH